MEKLAQRLLAVAGIVGVTGAGLLLSVILTGPGIVLLVGSALLVAASLGVRLIGYLTAEGPAIQGEIHIVRATHQAKPEGEAPVRSRAS